MSENQLTYLVWATKGRQPLISPAHEKILYPHIQGKADFLECQLHAIGGIEDHIHLIVSIPPKLSGVAESRYDSLDRAISEI